MKKKFLASALAASMVGTMFASMPAFAEEESSSAAAEEVNEPKKKATACPSLILFGKLSRKSPEKTFV